MAAVFRKLLQRGRTPSVHPFTESVLLAEAGHVDSTVASSVPGDLSRFWKRGASQPEFRSSLLPLEDDSLDGMLDFGSSEERRFFTDLLPGLSRTAALLTLPQASLDGLTASKLRAEGKRRVDFLVCRSHLPPLAIEIDGLQHNDSLQVDRDRDQLLLSAGIDTVRISAQEIRVGSGVGLERLRQIISFPDPPPPSEEERLLLHGPAQAHRFALALCELLETGALSSDDVWIDLQDDLSIPIDAYSPYMELLGAVAALWGGDGVLPRRVALGAGDAVVAFAWEADGFVRSSIADEYKGWQRASIRLEATRTPVHALASTSEPTVVVRPARLPVRPADPLFEGASRPPLMSGGSRLTRALETILVSVFAKESFREGQLEGITEVLGGRDSVVLLPTGAGKSLIYQLAGLVMPGRTLVIDPLISLIEDQVEGLQRIGIDRTAVFSSYQTQQGRGDEALAATASGEALFAFLAPERLQQSSFRDAVRTLAYSSTVNLAVVDEAHCVSEWGHDFRTAYLRLGRVLRDVCRDTRGMPPPILALTGTASRAVLRDVLLELGIERRSENSVVRPDSFDRPELRFSVVRVPTSEAVPALIGLLRTLPGRLGTSAVDAFRPRGTDTTSGIVFVPWVNGEFGVIDVASMMAAALGGTPAVYSGSAPRNAAPGDWEEAKRRNATAFKENESPVLVSTKAFGMGIDKPNVRYVIHYGLPSSIEAFYQEAGRAGRDRRPAECAVVLIERDERRNRELLEERTPLERSRQQYEALGRSDQDDVTRQLFFHFNSFGGVQAELRSVQDVMALLGNLTSRRRVEIPFGDADSRSGREKALHRLVVLGVIRDYLVEWGARKFVVELEGATSASVGAALVDHVMRYNRLRGAIEAEQSSGLRDLPIDAAVVGAAERLIRFTYETIELSRRRSLLEIWLAARESAASGGDALRARVLAYLTEGDLSPALVGLLDAPELNLAEWHSVVEQAVDDDEARELRGSASRLLESYPDHPGLLFARAWSEFLDSRGDVQELYSNLTAALGSALTNYAIEGAVLAQFLDSLIQPSSEQSSLTAIAAAALEVGLSPLSVEALLESALEAEGAPGLKVLALQRRLKQSRKRIEAVLR